MANPVANTETRLAQDVAGFQVVERGRNFVKHAVTDARLTAPESYCLDLSMGPMHYDDGGYWRPIDTTLSADAARVGADIGQKTGGYESHFNLSLSAPWTAEYRKGTQAIRFKPVRLQSGTKQWPVNQAVVGLVLGDRIRWANAFGAGIHLEWTAGAGVFAKNVIIDKPLTLTADLDLVIEVQVENLALPEITPARFLALGENSSLRWPVSDDAEGNQVDGKLLLSKASGKQYLTHRVPKAWLDKAVYPVAVDYTVYDGNPIYNVAASADDGHIYYADAGSVWTYSNTTINFRWGLLIAASYYKSGSEARFLNVQVPRGAQMLGLGYDSQFQVQVASTSGATVCSAYLSCSDEDNAAQIADAADWLARTLTTAKVDWTVNYAWTAGEIYSYPITAPVQEVINRDGWREGNALMVFCDDRDARSAKSRTCVSYDKGGGYAPPQLRLYYCVDDFGQVF